MALAERTLAGGLITEAVTGFTCHSGYIRAGYGIGLAVKLRLPAGVRR